PLPAYFKTAPLELFPAVEDIGLVAVDNPDQFVLWLFAGDDHSTGCMIEVVRATSTAAAGHDGNDDGEEDNCADGACNSSSAPTTYRNSDLVMQSMYIIIVVVLYVNVMAKNVIVNQVEYQ
ncbi:hypothetical protein pdam_00015098, partial [Pocillopora damicornis]